MTFKNPQIELDALPRSDTLDWRRLDGRYAPISALLSALFSAAIYGAILGASILRGREPDSISLALGVGFAISAAIGLGVWVQLRVRRYVVRSHDVGYSKGLIFRSTTFVAFNRVQHVEVSRGPIDRNVGLASLKFFTAGGSGADLSIPGLTVSNADALRQRVIREVDDGH